MKLYEYQAKVILKEYSLKVPQGSVVRDPREAREIAKLIGKPVYVKAQILGISRAKKGGIIRAESPEEAYRIASRLLGSYIGGEEVSSLLIEEEVDYVREIYLAFLVDGNSKSYLLISSPKGGTGVEELEASKVTNYIINPLIGLSDYIIRGVLSNLGLEREFYPILRETIHKLYKVFVDYDCELMEVNPLVITNEGELYVLDPKMIIDDNSLWRHPELPLSSACANLRERKAKSLGLTYVEMDGDIGVIGNGAGLTMSTMDLVEEYGGRPACFLDLGGGVKALTVKEAIKLVLGRGVKAILINVIGGITRCDEVARGIISALREVKPRGVKIVVRMLGTLGEEGRKILIRNGIPTYEELEEALKEVTSRD